MFSANRTIASVLSLLFAWCVLVFPGNGAARRPRILRISSVIILAQNPAASFNFYAKAIPLDGYRDWFEGPPRNLILINERQSISLSPTRSPLPTNLIGAVTFDTDNLDDVARYLTAKGISYSKMEPFPGIDVVDPEGHQIVFNGGDGSPRADCEPLYYPSSRPDLRIIHVGFVVRDRATMEHFYKDILGFRPYWHGGMKDDKDDWVSLQLPDACQWIEFMLNVPDDADQKLRGVMNHIAIGVQNVRSAQNILVKHGVTLTEQPKIGRDGKWQLNVYDPDETRIEIMGLTPVEKPCCSKYTGPHPHL